MWQSSSSEHTKTNGSSIHWKGASSETLQHICTQQQREINIGSILLEGVDVIVCDESASRPTTKSQVYFSADGIVIFHPRSGHELADWQYLFPRPTTRPDTLQFQLLIEQSIYNKTSSASFL